MMLAFLLGSGCFSGDESGGGKSVATRSEPNEGETGRPRMTYREAIHEVARIVGEQGLGKYRGVEATYDSDCRVVSLIVQPWSESKLPRAGASAAFESEIRSVLEALGRDDCPPERRFALTLLTDFEVRDR